MESGLTPKQLSWMFLQLLDVMRDVRATMIVWGMSSATPGWWVLMTSRFWRTCHKSRESDIWWEVFEMIFACNLQLKKLDPWNKGCLCTLTWGKQPMHASLFFSAPEGTSKLNCTFKRLLNYWYNMHISGWDLVFMLRIFVQFLGRAVGCYWYLWKFCAKHSS